MGSKTLTDRDIGKTIRTLRKKMGREYSTTMLARKIGISQAQLSRLELGRQGFRSGTLCKIADALRVPSFRLFMTDAEWAAWEAVKDDE
jgi:transcriptional regulator with XRE-family HTH domain